MGNIHNENEVNNGYIILSRFIHYTSSVGNIHNENEVNNGYSLPTVLEHRLTR